MESKKIKRLMCSVITATLLLSEVPGVAPVMESVGIVREVEAASVGLSNTKVSVLTGEKYSVTLNGISSKKKKQVTWKSSSKNLVVSYSKKDARKVTFYARKAGNYKVTGTYGNKKYTVTVKAKKGMNVTSTTLDKGKKYTLKLSNVKGKVKWTSSKKSVVTVKAAKNGKSASIVAKKPGTATVTATVGKKKLYCTITVKGTTAVVTPQPQPTEAPKPTEIPSPTPTPTTPVEPTPEVVEVNEIKLDKKELTFVALNQTASIKATVEPEDAEDKRVGWNSTDRSVVTVDQGGTVTAVGNGNAYVICYSKSNSNVFARCEVSVQAPEPDTPANVKAESISLKYKSIDLNNEEYTWELIPTIKPDNSDELDVVWETDNPKVATVSDDGVVTAMGTGTTKVRCYIKTNRSIYAECTVNVDFGDIVVKATGITLNPSEGLNLVEGDSSKITATVAPSNATNSSVKWVSSSPDVAIVDDSGNVTALKAGSTMITCTAVDGSGVSASCTVTVTAKSTTSPSETEKTKYTYRVSTDLNYGPFNGGDLIGTNIYTNAPLDKVVVEVSNNNIQYNTVFVNKEKGYYCFSHCARKKGTCRVAIYIDNVKMESWDVIVTSDDKNWATYESWLNGVLGNIKGSNSDFDKLNPIQKITLLGQYILDNYDYNEDPNKSFHNHGCGNCNASSFVLKDYAQRLGLRSEVVTPKMYAGNASTSSHVVAKIYYDGKIYHVDAGLGGKAPRGKISIMYWNANEYNG